MCKNYLPLETIPIEHHHKNTIHEYNSSRICHLYVAFLREYVIYMLPPYYEFTDKNDILQN